MRVTQTLWRQHIGWTFKQHWKVQRHRVPVATGADLVLSQMNIPVVPAEDIVAPSPMRKELKFVGLEDRPLPWDECHPLYHKQECHMYGNHSVLLKGLDQAKVLTNTVELEQGLPAALPRVTASARHHHLVNNLVLDAEQKKLPKLKDPERPAFNFPRVYGITDIRGTRFEWLTYYRIFVGYCWHSSSEDEHLKSVTDNEVCSLLNLGTCGLHVVHGSLRTGVESVDWDISSLLRHMYYLFTDSPARRALFTQLTGCTTFPLKFCGVRWLENAKCFQRALQIWDHVIKFLKEAKLPKTKPVETLKRAACDPFLKCKLAFCKTIADECQPFLQRFQTSKPMTPYLFEAVEKLLRYLMNRCVKPDLMKCTGPKLLSIDTKKSENLILSKNIDIGFATKRLLGETAITVTERQKLEFIHECRSMLTTMIAKLQEKSPLKQKAVRGLSSLDPCVIQHSPQLAQKRFSFLLEELNHANIINDVLAENAKKEYLHFCNLKKSELQEIFRPCDQFSDEVGLDTIYGSFLIGEANYKHLWEVIKICLVLSHGNATVEGGFSVNKSLLVENMHEKTVIAQRHIHDEIQEAGGIKNIHISKKMLDYVRGARKRYHEYLEMKKQEKSEKDKKKAEKRKLDIQVKDLEGERKKLMMATEEKREAIDVELQELKKKQASLY
uniref:Uncharacterized protein n=1 Tax=Timema monikensis TaxID=170555 RepID=A0A7R9E1W4_9NEOP|nr:unnamed protein product [Timema monikensis]